ncbi:MAG: undecaprenyl/decaprenyl-phosphate alpha-N-acetylglucosaminyl 1-phosphate transferase, partial [Gammaproteobacteria bacterium]|nr:undecaprenyl/decaprenyl-phosphate alpha-N-acetylglucosaminyl 1-phosphate transferase [Gammaproteobacteria bacterium]
MVRLVITSLVTFVVTLLMVRVLVRLAPRIGLVDEPGVRRQHSSPTPLVGGLAMFVGLQFSVLVGELTVGPMRALLAGAAILVIVGVLDDMHELSSRARFVAQLVAAMLMVYWGGAVLADLGALWSDTVVHLN